MAKNNGEALKLAQQLVKILSADGGSGVQMPKPDDVEDLSKEQVSEIAEAFSISIEGKKTSAAKALIATAANIVAGETDELEDDEVTALCEATGVTPKKKTAATVEALKDYFDSVQDSEDGEAEGDDDDDEKEDSDDDDDKESSDDDDDDDDKPKGKKGKKSKDDDADEDEDDEDSDSDDDEDEKPKKKTKKDDDDEDGDDDESDSSDDDGDEDEDEDEDEDGPDEKEQAKRVKAFNKVAKKKVKDYAALKKLLVDNDGDDAEWAEPYVKGEEAFCCGLPLATIKKDGKKLGKCQVTGKLFKQDKDGALVEVDADDDGDDDGDEE